MILELRIRQVGPWGMNSHGLVCSSTGESILVDPGAEPDKLAAMLDSSQPQAIIVTHSHGDHVGALAEMRARLRVPIMAHPDAWVGDVGVPVDEPLAHGQRLSVGAHTLRVYHTPGHTDDQICVAVESDHRVVVGDTIFEGGPGKTWSSQGFQVTLGTLRDIVLPWPDTAVLYPGHGPSFRLGDQRPAIEAFLRKDHGHFFGDATWGM